MAGRVECQSTAVGAKPKNPALCAIVDQRSTLPSRQAVRPPQTERPRSAPRPFLYCMDPTGYLVISTFLVSRRNRPPITTDISAIAIGYHRP